MDNIIEFGDPEKEENPGNQKRFWSYIKSLRKDTSGESPLKENGKMHADPKDKAAILNRQYESVCTKEDISTTIPQPASNSIPSMPDINISEEGVFKLLLKINPNKACGPDLITARILIYQEKYHLFGPDSSKAHSTMVMSQQIGSIPPLLQFSRKETDLRPAIIYPFP